jgi:hypothetical protein
VIAAFLLAALAIDLALVFVAASPAGFAGVVGPFHIRLHDPHAQLVAAALLSGALVAVCARTRARAWSLAAFVITITLAGVAVTRSAADVFPLGDIAVIEMYVRDALAGRLLVGPYSRFGWHHPGPIYFYLLAPVYWAARMSTASLAAGGLLMAGGAIALSVWTAARSAGARAAVILLSALTVYVARVPGLLASAWNPHVVVLPAAALIVAAAAAAGGDAAALVLTAALASFVMQTDVALVPVASALAAIALAGVVAAARRAEPGPLRWRAMRGLNATAWVIFALWLLPLAEEIRHTPGNLTLLWRFFVGGGPAGQTARHAAEAWAAMLNAPVSSLSLATGGTFETAHGTLEIACAVLQMALVATAAARVRRAQPGLCRLALVSLAASGIAFWSVTRIADRIMDHEVFWISAIGVVNVAIVATAVLSEAAVALSGSVERIRSSGTVWNRLSRGWPYEAFAQGAAFAAIGLVCVGQMERARAGRLPVTATAPAVERLAGSVRVYLEWQKTHKPLVHLGEDTWGLSAGVLLQMDREGRDFAIEDSWMPMFPQSFARAGDEDAEIAFGNADEHLARGRVPGVEPIGTFSNLYIDGLTRPSTSR